ncbi:hypothetical protein SPD48_07980 [Pseudogracilibacillus sp. SE30717A]|uniref:hypothetical protein n=1 Tax=Pseudogracilibacillus sp. SE30717A TaxID=3098293 RepID=UPI00300DEF66
MVLTLAHWIYLFGTILIILTMLFKKNVVVPAISVTFFVALAYTGSFGIALQSTFRASLVAAGSLFDIFLIIAVMTALLRSLKELGADQKMIVPFQKVMVNGHISFLILAVITYAISLFFWPTPAVPLVGAILIPAAIRAGLPSVGAGVAIALAGQGMALSSDYIIQIAPTLSASASNLSVNVVADRALVLSVITGVIALVLAYITIRKLIQSPAESHLHAWEKDSTNDSSNVEKEENLQTSKSNAKKGNFFAFLVPISFLFLVGFMIYSKISGSIEMEGGEGAALIGGAAMLLLIAASMTSNIKNSLEQVSKHIIGGLIFAFKAMGIVLPIAGFFFLGNDETASQILSVSENAPAFLFELILASEHLIPNNGFLAAFGMLLIGMITGLDGSGFSGLPLTGALAGPLGTTMGVDPATLAAIGQMGAIWVGGGTLIAWSSLVAVAGFARVPVMDLVRKCFLPVVIGLIVSTFVAILFF